MKKVIVFCLLASANTFAATFNCNPEKSGDLTKGISGVVYNSDLIGYLKMDTYGDGLFSLDKVVAKDNSYNPTSMKNYNSFNISDLDENGSYRLNLLLPKNILARKSFKAFLRYELDGGVSGYEEQSCEIQF